MLFLANTTKNITVLDSLLVLLLGMLIIFLVLTVLIFVVKGYVGVFSLFSKKDKKEKVEKKVEQVVPVATPVATASNDEETVAAIMAAITAYYMSESANGEVPPFRVKSIILK